MRRNMIRGMYIVMRMKNVINTLQDSKWKSRWSFSSDIFLSYKLEILFFARRSQLSLSLYPTSMAIYRLKTPFGSYHVSSEAKDVTRCNLSVDSYA